MKGVRRLSLTVPTVKVLWARAHNQCAFPNCRQPLTEESRDASTGVVRAVAVGEQAHIRSYKPNGPRYDPQYAQEQLHSYENLILLCPTHHAKVDANGGSDFTVTDLTEMKVAHEKQSQRREDIDTTVRKYVAQQYGVDDKVLFEQVDLNGPSVDSMFVDVPFSCRPDASPAELLIRIADESPGDSDDSDRLDGHVVTGAAQALLHPDWLGNALLVGGPGQGKSTLLQYVCQFYRARLLGREEYTGEHQQLRDVTRVQRVPIRLDLRKYAVWAVRHQSTSTAEGSRGASGQGADGHAPHWRTIEEYIASEIARNSGRGFTVEDLGFLVTSRPVVVALDGLDEVANLSAREEVSRQIAYTQLRLAVDSSDLTVLVATRPGGTTSTLWSSGAFPRLNLRRLTHGLRVQYLQRWAAVAKLSEDASDKLQRTFMEHHNVPHIQELASYPMQLAILLHLLHRRQLLPQQRTELYGEYMKTFLDREQSGDKEPLLAEERKLIEDIHAYIGWYIHTRTEEGHSSGSIRRSDLQKLLREHLDGRDNGPQLADRLFAAFTTRVLCLVERDPGAFQFEVQSLREYFAAIYLYEEVDRRYRDDCLGALLKRPYWSNVCRFYVGKYTKGEVRGMRSVVQEASRETSLAVHHLLRAASAHFLNDRTYEGQKDEPIQEIVDFVLGGPGVVLAEDGLLDVSGSGLQLSERAGRLQAVRHLKLRLETETDIETRVASASSLRRHARDDDDVASWWWSQYDGTITWLMTASQLRVLARLEQQAELKLANVLAVADSDSKWVTELLAAGGYDGIDNDVLRLVMEDMNDGAVDGVGGIDPGSTVGRILAGATTAILRPTARGGAIAGGSSGTRLRNRGLASLLPAIVASTEELRSRPADAATDAWLARLTRVAELWGDGWILRQAVAALPEAMAISTMLQSVPRGQSKLRDVLAMEGAMRMHGDDGDWWRESLTRASDSLSQRHWVCSLLARAHSPVVIATGSELSAVLDRMSPKHFSALHRAVRSGATFRANPLVLRDAIRLNQVTLSPRALLLLRDVATTASIEQIDRRLADNIEEMFSHVGRDDYLRDFARRVSSRKTIRFDTFRGHRRSFPLGGWSSDIRVGAPRPKQALDVLQQPQLWPADLVQQAAQKVEGRMLAQLPPFALEASSGHWFNT
jgi:hypothetical protein